MTFTADSNKLRGDSDSFPSASDEGVLSFVKRPLPSFEMTVSSSPYASLPLCFEDPFDDPSMEPLLSDRTTKWNQWMIQDMGVSHLCSCKWSSNVCLAFSIPSLILQAPKEAQKISYPIPTKAHASANGRSMLFLTKKVQLVSVHIKKSNGNLSCKSSSNTSLCVDTAACLILTQRILSLPDGSRDKDISTRNSRTVTLHPPWRLAASKSSNPSDLYGTPTHPHGRRSSTSWRSSSNKQVIATSHRILQRMFLCPVGSSVNVASTNFTCLAILRRLWRWNDSNCCNPWGLSLTSKYPESQQFAEILYFNISFV